MKNYILLILCTITTASLICKDKKSKDPIKDMFAQGEVLYSDPKTQGIDTQATMSLLPIKASNTPGESYYVEVTFDNVKTAANNWKPLEIATGSNIFLQEFFPKTDPSVEEWSKLMTTTTFIGRQEQAPQILDNIIQKLQNESTTPIKLLHYSTNYPHKKPLDFKFGEATIVYSPKAMFKNPARTEVLYLQTYSGQNDACMIQYTIALSKEITEKKALEEIKQFKKNKIKIVQTDVLEPIIYSHLPVQTDPKPVILNAEQLQPQKKAHTRITNNNSKTPPTQHTKNIYGENIMYDIPIMQANSNAPKINVKISLHNMVQINNISNPAQEIHLFAPKSENLDNPKQGVTIFINSLDESKPTAEQIVNDMIMKFSKISIDPLKIISYTKNENHLYSEAKAICALTRLYEKKEKQIKLFSNIKGPMNNVSIVYTVTLTKEMTEAQAEQILKKFVTESISIVKK